jgi:glycogen operon protein
MVPVLLVLVALGLPAPGQNVPSRTGSTRAATAYADGTPRLGARYDAGGKTVTFRVYSSRATRIEVYLFATPFGEDEKAHFPLTPDAGSQVWSGQAPVVTLVRDGIDGPVYYGYRAWGPNWPFDEHWTKGSDAGLLGDVDADGNRFNPNKLLLDPYATEVSHDPRNPRNTDGTVYLSGKVDRLRDSGRVAPKGIVLPPDRTDTGARPERPLKDEIIYEVHLRGLTMQDPCVPEAARGTYRGAALKAAYLKDLGVTAVEFLPVQEFGNEQNDIDPTSAAGMDYWGYATLGFFAPDRRYAADKSPGGPTREFKEIVRAFHGQGIKVYLDVVYNHTAEGGLWQADDATRALVLSWRGLDNATYYELATDSRFYYDAGGKGSGGNNGVGPNFNVVRAPVRDQILDSLRYWKDVMGVDGFRFDLAPILANRIERNDYAFDPGDAKNVLNRAVKELPVRPADGGKGVELIAEPWGGQYALGAFPAGRSASNEGVERRSVARTVC